MSDHQHEEDFKRVSRQNSFTDVARDVEEMPPSGSGPLSGLVINPARAFVESTSYGKALRGRTDFESYELNQLIDLVEQTNPEHLESCGKALWDARDAIKAAADELSGHIENVDWVGESGDAFREWGRALVTSTHALSDFAGGAGDQITAAAMGLASVRKAMPPRDQRSDRKVPNDFPKAERVSTNEDYTAAVKVEKHRQEAINQMNRLSSYYSVSAEQLKNLQGSAPTFKDMPDVGVPRPTPAAGLASGNVVAPSVSAVVGGGGVTSYASSVDGSGLVKHHGSSDVIVPAPHVTDAARLDVPLAADTVTHINSVGALLPASASAVPGSTTPVNSVPDSGTDRSHAFGAAFGSQVPGGTAGYAANRTGSVRSSLPVQGRTAASSGDLSARTTDRDRAQAGRMGRTESTGQPMLRSTTPSGQMSPVGRGVSGGTPRLGGTTTPRASSDPASGTGRSSGVVGGRRSAVTGTPAKGGARLPRGTVVGGEEATERRSVTGWPGRGTVVGLPTSGRQPASESGSRGRATATGAVTGAPAARTSAARAERNGMTRGGAGLMRVLEQRGMRGDRREREEVKQPDRSVGGEGS